jgi:hypothetical protein
VTSIRDLARRATRLADRVAGVRKPDRALAQLVALNELRRDVEVALRAEVRAARAAGVSVTRIAEVLGLSRQAVTKQLRLARQRAEGD